MNEKTALLVIDMQLCAFDGKLIPAIHGGAVVLHMVGRLVNAARKAETPVIFIQHCSPIKGQPYTKGTHGWEVHPSIAPNSIESVVHKAQSSGFLGTGLEKLLKDRGIDTVTPAVFRVSIAYPIPVFPRLK